MSKIFTLLILLLLLPVTALAAEGAPGSLYVAGQQITDEGYYTQSGGNWTKSGDASTPPSAPYFHYTKGNDNTPATLTLSGATIQGGTSTGSVPYGAGIYAQCSIGQSVTLTIKLIGENTITGYYGIYVNAEISENSNGTDASLTITGKNNVSLEVSGSFYGIFVKSGTGNASVTIENASVDAKTTQTNSGYAGVCVQSGASSKDSPNLSLAVNGGSLTTSGSEGNDGIWFYVGSSQATGATTNLTVSNNAIVRAENGIKAGHVDKPTPSGTGIVFDGTEGTVYGTVELQKDLEIKSGETLTIPQGSSLNARGTLTNEGTINVESGGSVSGNLSGGTPLTTPSITAQPTDQTVTEGQSATFTVEASAGSETPTYQWQQKTAASGSDWTDISQETSASYTISSTTTSMSGNQYRCVVKSASGVSVISQAATLTVNAPTTYTISADIDPVEAGTVTVNGSGTSASVAAGSPVTLNAAANEGYRFTGWMENDQQVSTNATYTFNANGDRTLTAKFEKKVTGVTLNTETLELFTGGSATLTATVEPSDAANQNVTWQSDNANVATVQNGTVNAVGAGEATITVTTEDGEYTATSTVTVTQSIHSITADITALNFGNAYTGYTQPAAQTVTITNTGNQTLNLDQPASTSHFEVGNLSKTKLAPNEKATFTVQPKAGLAAGTYSEDITVSSSEGATLSITASFNVRKEVKVEPSGSTNLSFTTDRDEFTLTAIVYGENLSQEPNCWEWTVEDKDVVERVTLRSKAVSYSTSRQAFTIKGTGTTTITATYDDGTYRGSVDFKVRISKPTPPDPISYYNIYVEDVCDGVEVSTSKQVVREGGSINVYVEKDTARYTFDNFKVYYKRSYYGGWEELKEGTQPGEYPIKNIWTHIYIKAEGAEEKEDPTGIESIEGVKVYTKDGSLYVQTPQREQIIIVSMSGAVVKNEEQIGLKQYHGLQPGIYIVRVGDRAYKVRLN